MKAAASEPAEGATTLKKKAQEKLAAKANPVAETVVEVSEPVANDAVAEVSEPVSEVAASEVPAVEATADAVVETEAAPE
jgi:small subunit ribosomal protein S16